MVVTDVAAIAPMISNSNWVAFLSIFYSSNFVGIAGIVNVL